MKKYIDAVHIFRERPGKKKNVTGSVGQWENQPMGSATDEEEAVVAVLIVEVLIIICFSLWFVMEIIQVVNVVFVAAVVSDECQSKVLLLLQIKKFRL